MEHEGKLIKRAFFQWFICWAEIADGIVGVLTLGIVRPAWSYKVCMYDALDEARERAND